MPYVDWGQVDEGGDGFEPMPNGTYDARLDAWERKEGPSGYDYYNATYVLLESAGEFKNRKVWATYSLAPKAAFRFRRDMIRLGARKEDMQAGTEMDEDDIIAGQVGAECRLRLVQKKYPKNDGTEGVKNEIVEVLAPSYTLA